MLTLKDAQKRFESIQNDIKYEFTLLLSKESLYKGLAVIDFVCNQTKDLFLDFRGKVILYIKING